MLWSQINFHHNRVVLRVVCPLFTELTQEGSTFRDPVILRLFGRQVDEHHEVGGVTRGGEYTGPGRRLVQRGNVVRGIRDKVHLGLHVEHTEGGVHHALNGVGDHHLFLVPATTIHEHSMDQYSILGGRQPFVKLDLLPKLQFGHLCGDLLLLAEVREGVEVEGQVINGQVVLPGVVL